MDKLFVQKESVGEQKTIASVIAAYIENARASKTTKTERESALKCIFDLMIAVVPGINDAGSSAVRQTALSTMGKGNSSIWLCGDSCSVIGSAWSNSSAASALDLDDGHRLARGHPGAAVIPTAFAIAEETGATFDELIAAIVIGYEVGVTIAAARRTYGNTGTWSSFAVVATAAALRKTAGDIIEHALAIAGESAPNQSFSSCEVRVPVPEGSHIKEGIPWSVVTGLMALNLAEAGHTGPRNILNSTTHYSFPDELDMGSGKHICHVYFKLYSCCRHIHSPLDALIGLLEQHDLRNRTIDRISVETYSGALRISNRVKPLDLVDIQYSIPYCLALALIRGPNTLLPLTKGALADEEVESLASKVQMLSIPEFEISFPKKTLSRVTVFCGNESYTSNVTSPRGEATNPLSWEMLEGKFFAVTSNIINRDQQVQILNAVGRLRKGEWEHFLKPLQKIES